ncbi:MAG: BadF/BadG/BcrA/BcrD ATPase family protein [Pseudomonadota bacterium]
MTLVMGIDGGGTTCRAALATRDGEILGRGEAGPANIWTDPEEAADNIRLSGERAFSAAGRLVDWDSVSAVLGLAGANLPQARERLGTLPPFARFDLQTDSMIALNGALGDRDGIVLVTGTGSVFGRQIAGEARFLGGWGFRLGDQASGAHMGRRLLEQALLAHDGLAPTEPLLTRVLAEAGGPEALVASVANAPAARFADYMPQLLAAATEGEPACRDILREAEHALLQVISRFDAEKPDLPICCLGGLGQVFADRLSPILPGRIRNAAGTALDGAVALACNLAVEAHSTLERNRI